EELNIKHRHTYVRSLWFTSFFEHVNRKPLPLSHHLLQLFKIPRLSLVLPGKRAGNGGSCELDLLSDRFREGTLMGIKIIFKHFKRFISGQTAIHQDVERH